MFKKECIEKMKHDAELQELQKKVLSFSEKMGDAAYLIGKDKSYEDYKERLRKMVKEHEATSQQTGGIFIPKKKNCTGATEYFNEREHL